MLTVLVIIVLTICRTQNDEALRAKVDEAMNVYHEYVKNQQPGMQGDESAPSVNGGQENMNPSGEEAKEVQT